MTAGLTVVDDLGDETADRWGPRGIGPADEVLNGGDQDTAVLRLVKDDPFASISELSRAVRETGLFPDAGWWRIFGVLRRHGLLSRRSRFRFGRGRGRGPARRF